MHQIGQGYYYNVYDLENGRVFKKRTSHLVRIKKLLKWYGKTLLKIVGILFLYPKHARAAHHSLIRSVKTSKLNLAIFGNPIFKTRFEYEQDKAIPLEDYFKNHTLDENKVRFDEYPLLLHALWKYGISDIVFNFTLNNGVSLKTNKLIYIDFNEFTDSKEKIREFIKTEKWCTQASLRDMPDGELKQHIILKMKEEITEDKLEQFWNR